MSSRLPPVTVGSCPVMWNRDSVLREHLARAVSCPACGLARTEAIYSLVPRRRVRGQALTDLFTAMIPEDLPNSL